MNEILKFASENESFFLATFGLAALVIIVMAVCKALSIRVEIKIVKTK